MGRQTTGDEVAVAAAVNGGGGGSGNVAYWERQQRGLVVGRLPRLASFTPRDDGAGGNKREEAYMPRPQTPRRRAAHVGCSDEPIEGN